MKISKENAIVIFINLLFIAWCAFCLFGCATKKKTVDISKSEAEYSQRSEGTSGHSGNLNIKSGFEGFGVSEFAQAASFLNWDFAGANPEDEFSILINQTETGYEMKATGTGTANGGQNREESHTKWEAEWESRYDSLYSSFESYKAEADARFAAYNKDKFTDKESTGFQAGVYIIAGLYLLLMLLFLMLGWKVRKLGKSIQAFLNFKNLLKDG